MVVLFNLSTGETKTDRPLESLGQLHLLREFQTMERPWLKRYLRNDTVMLTSDLHVSLHTVPTTLLYIFPNGRTRR